MWGCDAALLGITAALPSMTVDVLRAWFRNDTAGFVAASSRLDCFAATTFCDPMDGYVQRMLWAAVWQGILPEEAAFDPWSPHLPDGERDRVVRQLEKTAGYLVTPGQH